MELKEEVFHVRRYRKVMVAISRLCAYREMEKVVLDNPDSLKNPMLAQSWAHAKQWADTMPNPVKMKLGEWVTKAAGPSASWMPEEYIDVALGQDEDSEPCCASDQIPTEAEMLSTVATAKHHAHQRKLKLIDKVDELLMNKGHVKLSHYALGQDLAVQLSNVFIKKGYEAVHHEGYSEIGMPKDLIGLFNEDAVS